ncbi:MAG TPA: hypothetical protein VEX18_19880 [Polyangiaceae bacterium]|nr:hypothetical protein [Polyangiaceae bacterium]
MTINGIGYNHGFAAAACQSTEARLAALLVSNEAAQQATDQELLEQARLAFIDQSEAEVTAMHAEADAIRDGAWAQLGVMAVGVGLQGAALAGEASCLAPIAPSSRVLQATQGLGQTLANGGAGVAGQFSEAEAGQHRADGKAASGAAEEATWEMNDRRDAIARSRDEEQRATQWFGDAVKSASAATNAILSNMA